MFSKIKFPIRLKILVTLLVSVTSVVSIITFTMATMFHDDKATYLRDLTSTVALSTAEECGSILHGYVDRLEIFGRIHDQEDLPSHARQKLLEGYFNDFHELVGVISYHDGEEVSMVFDQASLTDLGITEEELEEYREREHESISELAPGELRVLNTSFGTSPTMTLTVARKPAPGMNSDVVSAMIRLDTLLGVTQRSSVFDVYLIDDGGRYLAHGDLVRLFRKEAAPLPEQLQGLDNESSAGVVVKFDRDGTKLIGGFADVGLGDALVGAEIPHAAVYLASRALLRRMVIVSLVLLVLAVVFSEIGAGRITKPLDRLMRATKKIGRGEFEVDVDVHSRDEIGALGESFNRMATELTDREQALEVAQNQLVQSEKMAAFGQIGAGIAHELKNPLAGILGCAQLTLRKMEADSPHRTNVELIEKETKRSKAIVENLLKFARQEKSVKKPIDVNEPVQESIAIVSHQMELHKVKLTSELTPNLPQVIGNANQIQQVVMNLMINAHQAMEGAPGSIHVATRCENDRVEIDVTDDGPGIPEDIQRKIFEPFFTTKPGGKGTGLGLSVSFGIVTDHEGVLSVESELGKGTRFRITLPLVERRRPSLELEAA